MAETKIDIHLSKRRLNKLNEQDDNWGIIREIKRLEKSVDKLSLTDDMIRLEEWVFFAIYIL